MEITQELLKEILEYDKETGELWWKKRGRHLFNGDDYTASRVCNSWNTRFAGRLAGDYISDVGYRLFSIFGKKYWTHRVIWMLVTGEWPKYIDHIDGDRSNNIWSNLRNVSKRENERNASRRIDNTSGVTGVYWNSRRNKYVARIGKDIFLGYFDDFDEAVEARKAAEQSHGYHKNHGRERS